MVNLEPLNNAIDTGLEEEGGCEEAVLDRAKVSAVVGALYGSKLLALLRIVWTHLDSAADVNASSACKDDDSNGSTAPPVCEALDETNSEGRVEAALDEASSATETKGVRMGGKLVIFSHFNGLLRLAAATLRRGGISFRSLCPSVKGYDHVQSHHFTQGAAGQRRPRQTPHRGEAWRRTRTSQELWEFQHMGIEVPVLLVPMRTGGGAAGLTLTVANVAILLDPSTAPLTMVQPTVQPPPMVQAPAHSANTSAVSASANISSDNQPPEQFKGLSNLERQAIGRLHRIGQQRRVIVLRIVAGGTVETRLISSGAGQALVQGDATSCQLLELLALVGMPIRSLQCTSPPPCF
jgi:hypothetical protein